MKVSLLCLGLAIFCFLFACVGLFTPAGSRAFDEMAGMIPVFIGLLSPLLLLASLITALLAWRSSRRTDH